MKRLLYLLLLIPIIYLASCSSSSDLSPVTTSLHGKWQYDTWLFNGDELLNDYVSYLNICEDSSYWKTEIFLDGNLSEYSQAGSFTISDDQTEGVFTVESVYKDDPDFSWIILDLPQTFSISIDKLDDNELDFSFAYAGNTEIITSVKTPTEPSCSYSLLAVIPGCTDSLAPNFNPLATIDDGSCDYTLCLDCFIEDLPNQAYFFIGVFCGEDLIMLADSSYTHFVSESLFSETGADILQPGFYSNNYPYAINCHDHPN